MSILNVSVTPDRALIGVDTEAVLHAAPVVGLVSKMVPMIHANAVFAMRGNSQVFEGVLSALMAGGGSFDTLLERMPKLIELVQRELKLYLERMGVDSTDMAKMGVQELVLVGWSPRAACIQGSVFKFDFALDAPMRQQHNIPAHYVAPWAPPLTAAPPLSTPAEMAAFALVQTRLMDERAPGGAAGGQFVVCEIVDRKMTITPVCDLPARDDGRPGAVAGRELSSA